MTLLNACTNSGTATGSVSLTPASAPMTFQVNLSSYPNKKFSAYVFSNNNLVGVVRSNAVTDATGRLTINAKAVDANNCVTGADAVQTGGLFSVHIRIDSNGNSGFVYPSGCAGDAGFLSTAGQGYAQLSGSTYSAWPYYASYVYNTYTAGFSFSNTGLGTVSRQVYCSILDGEILNPTIFTTSTMGFAQGSISFTSGSGTAVTTATFYNSSSSYYKYACWIDANNSGTYNSGDLIASGPGAGGSISNWTTVP